MRLVLQSMPFLSTYRLVISAAVALAVAAVFFAYAGPGAADRAQAAAIRTVAEQVRNEDAELTRRLRGPAGSAPASAPEPLRQLNAAVDSSGVHVLRLSPRPSSPGSYDVELETDFSGLIRFTTAIEAPGGTLRNLQLRHADAAPAGRLLASAALTIAGTRVAKAIAPIVSATRDPFASPATPDRFNHRLTGITRVENGWMATIDDRDYVQGDNLDGAQIVSVTEQQVILSANGVETTVPLPIAESSRSRPSGK